MPILQIGASHTSIYRHFSAGRVRQGPNPSINSALLTAVIEAMPRPLQEIDQELVEMGYFIEDIREGKCIRVLPERYVSATVYREAMTNYQLLYNYYRDCVGEFNKFLADSRHELKFPCVPDVAGQHIIRFDDHTMYSRRMRTDEYFKDRAQTQIDSILAEMQSIMAKVESLHSQNIIVDSEAFMERARQLMFERCDAIFHAATTRAATGA